MNSLFKDKKLLIGTQNPGKIKELEALLVPLGIKLISLEGKNIEEPEENGVTFLDNALLKARYYAKAFNMPTLADDSGLCIEALDQKPGVYTKPFIEELSTGEKTFFEHLEDILKDQGKTASMHCVLVMAWPDGHFESFEGICEGELIFPPRYAESGESGFGVDPIFKPNGHNKTFSEDIDYKRKVSHRFVALQKFIKFVDGS